MSKPPNLLETTPEFLAYLKHQKQCDQCGRAALPKNNIERCGKGQLLWAISMAASDAQAQEYASYYDRQQFQRNFAVFRGIFDRKPTDTERMAYNLACADLKEGVHTTYDQAMDKLVEAWDEVLRDKGDIPMNSRGGYNPETGEIETWTYTFGGEPTS